MIVKERDDAILQAQLFRDYQIECATRLFKVDHENCLAEYLVIFYFDIQFIPFRRKRKD